MSSIVLGDFSFPILDSALSFILILSLIFNAFLFYRGDGSYSIKY
jgi:hypothetical protein